MTRGHRRWRWVRRRGLSRRRGGGRSLRSFGGGRGLRTGAVVVVMNSRIRGEFPQWPAIGRESVRNRLVSKPNDQRHGAAHLIGSICAFRHGTAGVFRYSVARAILSSRYQCEYSGCVRRFRRVETVLGAMAAGRVTFPTCPRSMISSLGWRLSVLCENRSAVAVIESNCRVERVETGGASRSPLETCHFPHVISSSPGSSRSGSRL